MASSRVLLVAFAAVFAACQFPPGPTASPTPSASASAATTPSAVASPSPAPSASASPVQLGAATPVDAVDLLLPLGSPTACRPGGASAQWSAAAGCPVTLRLQQRLQSNPTSGPGGGADPICRCQNVGQMTSTLVSQAGTTALVRVMFSFGAGTSYQVSFGTVQQNGRWFVDDTNCGSPPNSIYDTPVKPCT